MATITEMEPTQTRMLNDRQLKDELQRIRQTDNLTNWYFLIRTYVYLFVVIGAAAWFFTYQQSSDLSFWWNVPVAIVAIILIGAGQHQLSGLSHEGTHHILFRNKYLNDLVSDLLCMFPLFSSTHHYRLQHLAHHQFVNDPERDPDISQLKRSGHWLDFPVARKAFVRSILKQLWIPRLIRFIRIRAVYNSVGTESNPYLRTGVKPSKTAVRTGLSYILLQIATLTSLFYVGNPVLLAVVPAVLWAVVCVIFALLPITCYHQSRVKPILSPKLTTILRISYITALFATLAWVTFLTGVPAVLYFAVLWVVPLFTSFALFMILRQLVQHGNGGRGRLSNTRVFLVNPLIRFAVFPMGQDYHLPHHLYSSIPHYRLHKLHELLMCYPEYASEGVVVEGYFRPPRLPQESPTVLDILETGHTNREDIYIDNTVMDAGDFDDEAAILRECERSAHSAQIKQ